jgi:predicted RNase H-like nuclease
VGSRYLGLDLAWSERAGSGVCVLDSHGTILHEDQLPPGQLTGWVCRWRGQRSVLALDAPLVVPAGSPALRPVERELHRRYGRFRAGPFPGGAASSAMRGRDRSPAGALAATVGGYVLDPTDTTSAHRAIEVFPAPTWIELFGLSERVVYKRGPKAARAAGLERLRSLLDRLAASDPPLRAPAGNRLDGLVATARTADQWKAVEDIIDARLCAYVAQLWDLEGTADWIVTGEGTWRDGYVIIPERATGGLPAGA